MLRSKTLAAVCAGLLGLGAFLPGQAQAQQRSIINTGFEQNNPAGAGAPSYQIMPASAVPGWQSTTGFIELWDSGFNGVNAHAGAVFAEMNANDPGALYQNVCFTKGETIGWSFAHRARSGGAATQVANFEIASSTGVVLQQLASQATTVPEGWRVNSGTTSDTSDALTVQHVAIQNHTDPREIMTGARSDLRISELQAGHLADSRMTQSAHLMDGVTNLQQRGTQLRHESMRPPRTACQYTNH